MEAQSRAQGLLEDEMRVDNSQSSQAAMSQLETFPGQREGGQKEEGEDRDDGEQVDVVHRSLKAPASVTSGLAQQERIGSSCEMGPTLPPPMNFLEKTFRDWKVMLEPMAARKPPQLKVASEAEAAMTPPTMGTRDKSTGMLGMSPRNKLDRRTEKKGSMACKAGRWSGNSTL